MRPGISSRIGPSRTTTSCAPRPPRRACPLSSAAAASANGRARSSKSLMPACAPASVSTLRAATRRSISRRSIARWRAALRRPTSCWPSGRTSGRVRSCRCTATTPIEVSSRMLDRCDRVQIAVHDAAKAAQRFGQLLGGEIARRDHSRHLAAKRTVLAVGESEFELCEPNGAGLTQDFVSRRGEGLMTAGYCTADLDRMVKRWQGLGVGYDHDGEQLYLAPGVTFGLPIVISESRYRPRVGPVSFLYETTNTLVSDWRRVAAVYAGLFGLDPARFSDIGSDRFGYVGTLTLFAPPNRLDRIELSQVTDEVHAMGRFAKKWGDSLYMCYVEVHDWPAVRGRLLDAGARYTPRGSDPASDPDGGWVHPKELHGLLLGVSRTGLAWEWSGREDLVPPTCNDACSF